MRNPSSVFPSLGMAAVLALVCAAVLSFPQPAAAQGTCNYTCNGTMCTGTVAMFGCPSPGIMSLTAAPGCVAAVGTVSGAANSMAMATRTATGAGASCTFAFTGMCNVAPNTRTANCTFNTASGPPGLPVELMEFSLEPEPKAESSDDAADDE